MPLGTDEIQDSIIECLNMANIIAKAHDKSISEYIQKAVIEISDDR